MTVLAEKECLISVLAEEAATHGCAARCARLRSGAYVIYVPPETKDKSDAVLRVAIGIESRETGGQQP